MIPRRGGEKTMIVAEIGNNHEGNFDLACLLVDLAAECGADAVKFQTCRADRFISPADQERLARFRSYEFSRDQWQALARRAAAAGAGFMSTPLDVDSVTMLEPLVGAFKVASGDITFLPLIDRVAATGKPIVLSTGASTLDEIRRAVSLCRARWAVDGHRPDLAVLHCVSAYPVPIAQANLSAIPRLLSELDVVVGYSDHVIGIEAAVASVALGARIVEKHFTIDKNHSAFRDHQLSADPADFRDLVRRVRDLELMLGGGAKDVQPAEQPNLTAIRRSIVAARDLPAEHRVEPADLLWLRPATGLPPGEEPRLIGHRLRTPVRFGDPLTPEQVD